MNYLGYLLAEIGRSGCPVLLKRGLSATLEELGDENGNDEEEEDAGNRVAVRTDPLQISESYRYDTLGNLVSVDHAVTTEQYERWKKELSNWGRWGKDDQIGTLTNASPRYPRSGASRRFSSVETA